MTKFDKIAKANGAIHLICTCIAKVAVISLPEYVNFLQPRDSKHFKYRKMVEDCACLWFHVLSSGMGLVASW